MKKKLIVNSNDLLLLSLFILAFNFFLFLGLKIYESSILTNLLRLVSLMIFLFVLIIKECNVRNLVASFFVLLFIFMVNNNEYIINIIYLLFIINVIKYSSVDSIIKFCFHISFVLVLIHILLLGLGFTNTNSIEVHQVGERIRYPLGFYNTNALAAFYASFFYATFFYYLKIKNRFNFLSFILIIFSLIVMHLSGSRTFFYTSCIFIFIFLIPNKVTSNVLFRVLVATSPIIFSIVTIYISLQYDQPLNDVLSLRPSLFFQYLSKFDAFSVVFGLNYNTEDLIDNWFILMFAALGLPLYVITLVFISYKIWYASVEYLPFIFVMLISSVFESFLLRPEFLVSILALTFIFSSSSSSSSSSSKIKFQRVSCA